MPINPFIGMLSGNPVGAGMSAYNQMLDIQGQAALGRGIQDMFNPQVPGAIPMPGGGGPGGFLGGVGQGFQRLGQGVGQLFGGGGGGQPGATGAPMGGPQGGGPMPSMVGGGPPQPAPLGPGPQMSVAPQQLPPQPPPTPSQQAQQVPPGAGAAIGSMSYNDLLGHIVRANPGASPGVIGHALQKAVPFMNAQALAQYRAESLGLRERGQDITMRGQDIRQDVAQQGLALRAQNLTRQQIRDRVQWIQNGVTMGVIDPQRAQAEIDALQQQEQQLPRGSGAPQPQTTTQGTTTTVPQNVPRSGPPPGPQQPQQPQQPEAMQDRTPIEKSATAVIEGRESPSLNQIPAAKGQRAAVSRILQERGFDREAAVMQERQAQGLIRTAVSQRNTQLIDNIKTIDPIVKDLRQMSKQMAMGPYRALNWAQLTLAAQKGDPTAKAYMDRIGFLKEKLGVVMAQGFAPPKSVWELVNKQVNPNSGFVEFNKGLDALQAVVGYHQKAMESTFGSVMPGTTNPYLRGGQQTGQQPPQTQQTPPPDSPISRIQGGFGGLPQGWSVEVH